MPGQDIGRDKKCKDCGETKPLSAFYQRKEKRYLSTEYSSCCLPCRSARDKKWKKKNPEKVKGYRKKYYWKNQERTREYQKRENRENRIKVINHYGGKGQCCGEARIEFLAIDHKNNDGNKERKSLGDKRSWYLALRNGLPDSYQVLCHNCNLAKAFYGNGVCPYNNMHLTLRDKLKGEVEGIDNPYPKDIFSEISEKEWKKIGEVIEKNFSFSIDRISGNLYRRGFKIALSDILNLLETLE